MNKRLRVLQAMNRHRYLIAWAVGALLIAAYMVAICIWEPFLPVEWRP